MNFSLFVLFADSPSSNSIPVPYEHLIFLLMLGGILLALLVWYLISKNDKAKKIAGMLFLLGLCTFCIALFTFETKPTGKDEIISTTPYLELLPVHPNNTELVQEGDEEVPGWKLYIYEGDHGGKPFTEKLFLAESAEITEKDVQSVRVEPTQKGVVHVTLNKDGVHKMLNMTNQMRKGVDRIAIVVDGKVKSAPVIMSTLSKRFSISGLDAPGEIEKFIKILSNPTENENSIKISETDEAKNEEESPSDSAVIRLELLPVHPDNAQLVQEGVEDLPGWKLYTYEFEHGDKLLAEKFFLAESAVITNRDIKSAELDYARKDCVDITLTDSGAHKLWDLTSKMRKGLARLAIVIDGEVKSVPVVQSNLSKQFEISGLNVPGEAKELVEILSPPSPKESTTEENAE